ncbi:hypothetical protein [Mycobacterium sp. CnD-18-1]|uniref:hypothetical protein n=1 Tax=Mycobacterium sp. CnD-18-1 TaxID=2917744 RepID=UPI001EF3D4C6|nr:hypothetical protein [Mycobacterium sp. CnD-18-1]MCG7607180.1 hypothetical protein [Mycobacterium sp. CnD-18-1]
MTHEDALATALSVTDTSRRVGWAKYFSAVEQANELAHDYNLSQSDVRLLAESAGFLYGILSAIAPGIESELPKETYALGVLSMLPDSSISAGKRHGKKWKPRNSTSNQSIVDYAAKLLADRRDERDAIGNSVPVGESIDISSPGRDPHTVLEVEPRSCGGACIRFGKAGKKRYIYLDATEMENLAEVAEVVRSINRRTQ